MYCLLYLAFLISYKVSTIHLCHLYHNSVLLRAEFDSTLCAYHISLPMKLVFLFYLNFLCCVLVVSISILKLNTIRHQIIWKWVLLKICHLPANCWTTHHCHRQTGAHVLEAPAALGNQSSRAHWTLTAQSMFTPGTFFYLDQHWDQISKWRVRYRDFLFLSPQILIGEVVPRLLWERARSANSLRALQGLTRALQCHRLHCLLSGLFAAAWLLSL